MGGIAMRRILLATIFGTGFSTATLAQLQSTLNPSLPTLQSPDDPDATYCRPPQQLPDSRLLGPRVCMTNRQWDVLHSKGLEMSADGRNTITCRIGAAAAREAFVSCLKGRIP
jgi:hypothetical protein